MCVVRPLRVSVADMHIWMYIMTYQSWRYKRSAGAAQHDDAFRYTFGLVTMASTQIQSRDIAQSSRDTSDLWCMAILETNKEHILNSHCMREETDMTDYTVNELRPLYRLWLCRWGIHDSADLRSRYQHQAYEFSDVLSRQDKERQGEETCQRSRRPMHSAPCMQAGLELAYICIRIRVMNREATARHQHYCYLHERYV